MTVRCWGSPLNARLGRWSAHADDGHVKAGRKPLFCIPSLNMFDIQNEEHL